MASPVFMTAGPLLFNYKFNYKSMIPADH